MTTDNLEQKLEFDNSKLTSQAKFVTEKGETIVYQGSVNSSSFEGRGMIGEVTLGKYVKESKPGKRLKLSLSPLKIEVEKFHKFREIWEVTSRHKYLLSDGKTVTNDCSYGYKLNLKSELANKGIALSTEVFDKVFTPIDEELMHRYQAFTRGVK